MSKRSSFGVIRPWLAMLLLLLGFGAAAGPAPLETGPPVLRVFSPKEYDAADMNWAVVQGPRGLIYAANDSGVLEFDGVRWRLIPVANGSTVRSLAVDAAGRILVGAVGELGALEPDAAGQLRFVSWLDRIPAEDRAFTDVWKTFATQDGIIFASLARIFRFGSQVEVWRPQHAFHIAFLAGERVFVREPGRGLFELKDGAWNMVPGGERFSQERVYVLPGTRPDSVLIGTRNLGMFELAGAALRPFPTEVDAELKRDLLTTVLRLADGDMALATIEGGLYVLDAEGRFRAHLDRKDGLLDPVIQGMAQDRFGGVWLATGRGLARAELGFPVTAFTERSGIDGAVEAIHRHAGTLFVGTTRGAARLVPGLKDNARFVPIPEIKGETYSFLTVGPSLLAGNSLGVMEYRGGAARLVRPSPSPTTDLLRTTADPSRVLVGLSNGLASMRWDGARWVDEGKLPDLAETVLSLREAPDGRIWVGTYSQGLLRLTLPPGWQGGAALPTPKVERFGTDEGLPAAIGNAPRILAGRLAFCTSRGLYLFDESQGRFRPDPDFQRLAAGKPWALETVAKDARGNLWMTVVDGKHRETGVAREQSDGSLGWDTRPLRGQMEAAAIHEDEDGILWFGGDAGLFRYDRRRTEAPAQAFKPLIRRVAARGDSGIFGGQGQPGAPALPYKDNALRFEFASPYFPGLDAIRFQVLLEGVDADWSPWSSEAYRDYTSLREGSYRFRVRARNGVGTASEEDTFSFRILPPWYRTWWAYAAYLLGGGLSLAALVRWKLRALELEKKHLDDKVAERTEALAQKTETMMCLADLAADLQQAGTLAQFSRAALGQMARRLGLLVGAFYAWDEDQSLLIPAGGHGVLTEALPALALGQGLAGQCAKDRVPILMAEPEASGLHFAWGLGELEPRYLILQPILQGGRLLGVIALGFLRKPDPRERALLEAMLPMVAMSLEILNRNLATLRLAEELQGQREHLLETEAWYRSILESAPDGMLVADDQGRILLTNPKFDTMFGYGPGVLCGQSLEILVPEAVRAGHPDLRAGYLQGGASRPMGALDLGLAGLRRDGTEFKVDLALAMLPARGSQGPCVCVTARARNS